MSDRFLEQSININGRKKVRMSKSQMKTMLITFFDIKRIVHSEFILQG
jgi:hypothetical protein